MRAEATEPAPSGDFEPSSPIGRALVLIGDMWTVRIVREVFLGVRRFQDLRDALGVSDPVLARRLRSLVDDGVVLTRPYSTHPPRSEYLLTDAGLDLWQVLVAMWAWDRTWAGPTHPLASAELVHLTCDRATRPVFGDLACGAIGLSARDVQVDVADLVLHEATDRRSRRSPALAAPLDATGVLGDRWSTLLLADALMGSRRFTDFEAHLGIAPVTLTRRLALFVDVGLLTHDVARDGGRRRVYTPTPQAVDFFMVFAAVNRWAERWQSDDGASGLRFTHRACGRTLVPAYTCNACNEVLERGEVQFVGLDREAMRR
jgi:DNA-binding HxlR family transcriptional regulator